jgi:alpha-tubulin suppressor-like RCC1 family protein
MRAVGVVLALTSSACGGRTDLVASGVPTDGSAAHDSTPRSQALDARAPTADSPAWNESETTDLPDSSIIDAGIDIRVRADADAGDIVGATIALGLDHTCAVRPDGTVACWGKNSQGQLGDGTQMDHWMPQSVQGISGAVEIASGNDYSCVRLSDGTVRCWGNNDSGQLGDGTKGGTRSTPVRVSGLTGVRTLALGAVHSCAGLSDSTAKCWGANQSGQLGTGTTDASAVPVSVIGVSGVVELAAGKEPFFSFTCARLADHTVKCWGHNIGGVIGPACPTFTCPSPLPLEGLRGASAIGASEQHACAIVEGGTPVCWGLYFRANFPFKGFVPVEGISGAVEHAVGIMDACALLSTGGVSCWGSNSDGEFGDGTTYRTAFTEYIPGLTYGKPSVVSGLANAVEVAAGGHHMCARTADGHLVCWGLNASGQLGNPSTANALTPVRVAGWP